MVLFCAQDDQNDAKITIAERNYNTISGEIYNFRFCVGEFINDLVEAKNCILSHSFKPWRDSVNIFLHPSSPQMFFAILEVSYCNPFWAPDWRVIRNDYQLFTWFYIYSYSISMLPHIYFFWLTSSLKATQRSFQKTALTLWCINNFPVSMTLDLSHEYWGQRSLNMKNTVWKFLETTYLIRRNHFAIG